MEHVFINNKYKKHYDLLIEKSKNRFLKGKIEKHHILPKSLGGDNSPENIARLTPREHFIAHLLLVKFTEKQYRYKMVAALVRFGRKINSKQYELLRRIASDNSKGELNSSFNKVWIHHPETGQIEYVNKNNLHSYHQFVLGLPEQRGGFSKGRMWVNDGQNEFMIVSENFNNKLKIGRITKVNDSHLKHMASKRHTAEKDQEHSKKLTGRKSLFNPETGEYRKIAPKDIIEYVHNGWLIKSKPIKTKNPFCVEGNVYYYTNEILEKYNITSTELNRRLKLNSPKWINWFYLSKND